MRVVVVGGGAAGIFAAINSSKNGNEVVLIEKNEKLGKKLYITGKGRCNITNDCDQQEFLANIVHNSKFLNSSIYTFSSTDVINFFENNGLKIKIERGNRVFPLSDKSSDVIKCLSKLLIKNNVKICLNEKCIKINKVDGHIESVDTNKSKYYCDKVIVCTGGLSYPSTGSTGDGYELVKSLGHSITKLSPGLTGINLKSIEHKSLQGLTLKNISLKCFVNNKMIYNEFGEMLFTHYGVSGPLILSLSSYLYDKTLNNCVIQIDLKPALSFQQLDDRVLRDFLKFKNKQLKNSLDELLPKSLIPFIIKYSNLDGNINNNKISTFERTTLINSLKCLRFEVNSLRDFSEAIITCGGVNVKEINPKNMESKIVKGLFFGGEIIDCDALTGGFNLQIAFSTGYLASKDEVSYD